MTKRSLTILLALVCLMPSPTQPISAQAAGRAWIAFVTVDYSTREATISLVDPASGKIITLLKDGFFYYPMLSPDGKKIAFLGEHPRSRIQNVYVMNTDGTNLRLLLTGRPRYKPLGQVAWSPDSSEVFYGGADGNRRTAGFFRVKLGSDMPEQVPLEGFTSFYSTWITASPDGSRVAFNVNLEDRPYHQIIIANADGSNPQPVSATMPNGQSIDELAWSPDGQQTLLTVLMLNAIEPQPLLLGDANGANARQLIFPPPNYINSLSWSPDGKQIAFLAPDKGDAKPDGEVWIANADGSKAHTLNIPINVQYVGTSWRVIPDDVSLPAEPISFLDAIQ
ncbi:MAG: PD40 domain-containing protein [Anaerolineae bacterium]|nr:PD40 domain-containing protein [Anaerolineae bacterium]